MININIRVSNETPTLAMLFSHACTAPLVTPAGPAVITRDGHPHLSVLYVLYSTHIV
jgi:hypothetical protein